MQLTTLATLSAFFLGITQAAPLADSTEVPKNFTVGEPNLSGSLQQKIQIPDFVKRKAARVARSLVQQESIANVVALDSKTNTPVSFAEYYVDGLNTGDPVLAILQLSSTRRNVEHTQLLNKSVSISIRSYDHPNDDETFPEHLKYPGSFPKSVAGAPRVSFRGHLREFNATESQNTDLAKLYTHRHPDGELWVPGQGLNSFWAKFEIDEIYLLGGFGGLAYIGDIPVDMYHDAVPYTTEELEHWKLGW